MLTREEILKAAEEVLRRHGPAERFLNDMSAPLEQIDDDPRRWFDTLIATKRKRALEDPELFATYVALAQESGDVIRRHVDHLIAQLTKLVGDERTARAVFDATARFHDPRHADEWSAPGVDEAFDAVWALLAQAMARPASSAHSSAAR
jgi:hypothetical protein